MTTPPRQARRLAISNLAWSIGDDAAVAALLTAEGVSGVEIAPTKRWPSPLDATTTEIDDYRGFWESRGLPIVAMQALLFGRGDLLLFRSEDDRAALLDYLDGIFALGARLGARAHVFGSPKNRARGTLPIDAALDVATDFFANAAARAEAHGVVLCLEPNPPAYGCDFITTTAEAAALCRRVGRAGLRVQGDLGDITLVGDDVAVIETYAADIAHFHISEPNLVETGTGDADHAGAAQALRSAGYDGWCSIEMRENADGPAIESIARAVRIARRFYGG
jgi:sugar phosphate isomerase/epimerase